MLLGRTPKLNIDPDIVHGPVESVEHPDLRAMVALWKQKCGARAFPPRNAFSPRDMKDFLHHVHIYEVVDGGADFRARVVGTALIGEIDPTGRLLSDHPDRTLGERIAGICRLVVNLEKPIRVVVDHKVETDHFALMNVDSIWLPLGTNGKIEHILAQSILELTRKPIG